MPRVDIRRPARSEEHTSELQSPIDISYAVSCLKKKKITTARPIKFLFPSDAASAMPSRSISAASTSFFTLFFFFFNNTATTEIYTSIDTLSLHDALPISLLVVAPFLGLGAAGGS